MVWPEDVSVAGLRAGHLRAKLDYSGVIAALITGCVTGVSVVRDVCAILVGGGCVRASAVCAITRLAVQVRLVVVE
jgi:hypothetical protein